MASHAELRAQAAELRLHGLLAHWDDDGSARDRARVRQCWAGRATERARRSLERRLRERTSGRFKPLADFDWKLAHAVRPRGHRGADDAAVHDRRQQRRAGRPQRRGQVDDCAQPRATRRCAAGTRCCSPPPGVAGRTGRAGQRLGPAPAAAPLRRAGPAADRRGRLPVLLEPARRPAVRT